MGIVYVNYIWTWESCVRNKWTYLAHTHTRMCHMHMGIMNLKQLNSVVSHVHMCYFIWDSCMWILFAQQLNSVISHVHMCHVHTGYVHVNFIHIGIVYVNQYSNSASIFAQQLNSVVFTYTYGLYSYGYRICETTEQRTIFIWELCIWNNWIEDRKCRVLCLCCDIFTCDSCMWKKEKI